MKYDKFKNQIYTALQANPDGLSWKELRNTLNLPYEIPCQTWINQLVDEIQLIRSKGESRAYIWKINKN